MFAVGDPFFIKLAVRGGARGGDAAVGKAEVAGEGAEGGWFWVLSLESSVLGLGSWIFDLGFCILHSAFCILNFALLRILHFD
ncbi:MAG TPA: hypothetical protein PLP58_22785 [Prosthecobacter sp.]|nr:hypothetical protein [Prosthecobacter sp.]